MILPAICLHIMYLCVMWGFTFALNAGIQLYERPKLRAGIITDHRRYSRTVANTYECMTIAVRSWLLSRVIFLAILFSLPQR